MELNIKSNDRIFLAGMTGSGKTVLAKQMMDSCPRGIIYDIAWESALMSDGYEIVHDYKKIDFIKSQKWIVQPNNDKPAAFNKFCEWCFYECENLMLYVEEISDLVGKQSSPEFFGTILRRGRKQGIGCMMVTQMPVQVHKLCISQAQHVIVFKMFEARHIDYICECAGLGTKQGDMIRNLQDYEFFYYNLKEAQVMNPIEVEE